MRRSGWIAVVLLALMAGSVAPVGAVASASATAVAGTIDPAASTIIWGAHIRPGFGQSEQQAVQGLETQVGRKLAATREFRLWEDPFPTSYDTWLRNTGHLMLLSVKPKRANGTRILWRDIANAQTGSSLANEIVRWAQRVKAYGGPVKFTFNHEPETVANQVYGTDQEFIAAWRKVVNTFRAEGVTNAQFMWIMTDFGFDWPTTDRRYAPKWYPGDAWVDGMGIDAYNWFTCRAGISTAWRSLATIIESFRRFGALHPDKELWLPEWASAEDPANPNRKGQWITEAQALFKQPAYQQFHGILYFDHIDPNFPGCNFRVNSTATALDALRQMGADPFYTATVDTPPPPPSTKTAQLVVGDPANVTAGDAAIRDRLTSLGYSVTVADDSAPASDATGKDVVLLSSTGDSGQLGTKYANLAQPLIVWKPYLFGPLEMTAAGQYGIANGANITITDPASPLAAGRSGTIALTSQLANVPWGTPVASGHVVATRNGQPTIFSFDRGAVLDDGRLAASCRLAIPAYHTAPAAPTVYTADGWALFDAAVAWSDAC